MNREQNISGWGNYPKVKSKIYNISEENGIDLSSMQNCIAYGNGRSYGDSCLAKEVVKMKNHNLFLNFNSSSGLLHLQSGVLLSEILDVFVKKGWFLQITPGTKYITVGGAIASDVHGKNHHIEGCFSNWVQEISVLLPDGSIEKCSRDKNLELFLATCGGMGLTGIILDAKISLKKISSSKINQTTIKTRNLKETFKAFENYKNIPYSVAWIDCFAKEEKLGRSDLMLGDFMKDKELNYVPKSKVNIPFNFPGFLLNGWSIGLFNKLYYHKNIKKISERIVDIDSFFYPLDSMLNWNRIYGKNGFIQYQFILPKEHSYNGLKKMLKIIANSGEGSFLAVLKLYGKANDNYLSFPIEGYSLALDFKRTKSIFALLNRLDEIVIECGGRIYLTKDSRVSKSVFEKGYPKIRQFRNFRIKRGMVNTFNSLQSKRLKL